MPAYRSFRLVLAPLLVAVIAAMATAGTASAQSKPFTCKAAAISGTVLGQPIAPVAANPGAACATTKAGLANVLPAPVATSAVGASTVLTGPADRRDLQSAVAFGGVADLSVSALPELPIQLPIEDILALVPTIRIPLNIPLLLPPEIVIDVKPAVRALLPDGKLPKLDLLSIKALTAYAGAACKDGKPQMAGVSQVAGLSVLGQELPLNALTEQVLSLLDTTEIDLGKIDLSKVVLPAGLDILDPLLGPLLQAAIQPVLDAIPPIPIPAQLVKVKVTPGEQVKTADTLTQRALRIEVALLGQSLVDLSIGEATVGTAGVDCSPPAQRVESSATQLQLACTARKLVLVDVIERNGRVLLTGRADTKLAGRDVDIVFDATGKKVTTARVQPNGTFAATAPLPARHLREGNRARYRAQLGRERSDNLKLRRRMVVDSMVASAGKVTISGRVLPPLGAPIQTIRVQQRLSCTKNVDVATIKPSRSGHFKVTVKAPTSEKAAVYRVITKVPPTKRSKKRFATYTLPRAIDLG